MATSVSASASKPIEKQDHQRGRPHGIRELWREFIAIAFNSYRPELHYMRGPGPAWRAKHGERPPVHSQ
ncbi:hypothetical protein NB311A_14330 [Nitrobacter sp. Nb-311A]|uniref:hypothetical protein n=1 Tax=unclassified Nitrobacter TaxID=2620411 RepID=UPI0000687107|nr:MULTISPECIES: hypothetical protein [unclassified Nitrobacter]EAQ35080.1 hypothetical protein NB311A_14330 [Nitrobacter sp. Nb-311A]MCB1393012.1 hypothetical protein [Nitrobacter sp.]MCV0385527.1 hypothetical protein [Nitrobacter sp.]